MSRSLRARSWRGIVVLAIGMLAAGAFALSPVMSAQKPLTKKKADKRYINVGEKASDSDLLDGIDSTGFLETADAAGFQRSYSRTIVVSPGATEEASGDALEQALAGISGNSITNPFLIKLEPGIYDIGTTPLDTKPFVDIEGSGAFTTLIEGSGHPSLTQGTVMLDNNVELRFLEITNTGETGGQGQSRGVYVEDPGGRLSHVVINVSGADDNAVGISVPSGGVEISHALVRATAESTGDATGIVVAAPTFITDSDIGASGAGNPDYGIRVDGSTVEVDRSFLQGSTDALSNGGGTARVGLSRISGGVNGTVTCAGVYDSNYAFSATTCPA